MRHGRSSSASDSALRTSVVILAVSAWLLGFSVWIAWPSDIGEGPDHLRFELGEGDVQVVRNMDGGDELTPVLETGRCIGHVQARQQRLQTAAPVRGFFTGCRALSSSLGVADYRTVAFRSRRMTLLGRQVSAAGLPVVCAGV